MKKIIYSLIFLLPIIFVNFGCKKESPLPESEQITITDPRDGQTYRTVELNGQRWMAQNLNYDVGEGCLFYGNDPRNGEKYGRLYTWDAAQKACPPGWRLPTDQEIKELINFYRSRRQAYDALIEGGDSGFNALLGGWWAPYADPSFSHLGKYGLYWMGTEEDMQYAWYYIFDNYYRDLVPDVLEKSFGHSCRCLQN